MYVVVNNRHHLYKKNSPGGTIYIQSTINIIKLTNSYPKIQLLNKKNHLQKRRTQLIKKQRCCRRRFCGGWKSEWWCGAGVGGVFPSILLSLSLFSHNCRCCFSAPFHVHSVFILFVHLTPGTTSFQALSSIFFLNVLLVPKVFFLKKKRNLVKKNKTIFKAHSSVVPKSFFFP